MPSTRATSAAARRRAAGAATLGAAWLLLSAPAAHATATPGAVRVIDRYLTATGGRAAFDAERTLYQRGTVAGFGLTGTAEMWRVRPDRVRNVAVLGPLTITQGIDGDRAWRQISGNPLQWSDGKDLDADLAELWFECERWCEANQGGGHAELAPASAPRLPGGETLRITPPRGAPRLVEFNARGLVEIARERRDQLDLVYESHGYRLDAGRLRPHRESQHVVQAPANDTAVEITFSEVNTAMSDTLFLPGVGQAEHSPAFPPGVHAVRVPMTLRRSMPWVRVAVDGHEPAWFLVDSGSTLSCIDSTYATGLALRGDGTVQVQGVGAQAAVHLTTIDSLSLAGAEGHAFTVRDSHLAMLDLVGDFGGAGGTAFVGILGGDVLSRAVFTLDFDLGRLVIEDPATFMPPPGADAISFTLGSGVPVITATLDSVDTGLFRLDTGSANGVDLHGAFVEARGIAARAGRVVVADADGLGGTVTLHYFRARSLALGAAVLPWPVASMSQAETGAFTSEDYAGNIGTQVLSRFRPTFDYARRVLYLEPSAAFRDEVRLGQLLLAAQPDGWRVIGDPHRDGHGLRRGDVVAEIEGDAICVLSAAQLRERLQAASRDVVLELTVARPGRPAPLRLEFPAR